MRDMWPVVVVVVFFLLVGIGAWFADDLEKEVQLQTATCEKICWPRAASLIKSECQCASTTGWETP